VRAARGGDLDVKMRFEERKDGGDSGVEGEGFAVFVADRGGVNNRRSGGDGFERRGNVGVDPERPESVVEVEDDEGGERKCVLQGVGNRRRWRG